MRPVIAPDNTECPMCGAVSHHATWVVKDAETGVELHRGHYPECVEKYRELREPQVTR